MSVSIKLCIKEAKTEIRVSKVPLSLCVRPTTMKPKPLTSDQWPTSYPLQPVRRLINNQLQTLPRRHSLQWWPLSGSRALPGKWASPPSPKLPVQQRWAPPCRGSAGASCCGEAEVSFSGFMAFIQHHFSEKFAFPPFLMIIVGVQMVGQLVVQDGAVLSHIEHGDLITDGLVFGLRRKDLLREGPHLVIGLCRSDTNTTHVPGRNSFWHHAAPHWTSYGHGARHKQETMSCMITATVKCGHHELHLWHIKRRPYLQWCVQTPSHALYTWPKTDAATTSLQLWPPLWAADTKSHAYRKN